MSYSQVKTEHSEHCVLVRAEGTESSIEMQSSGMLLSFDSEKSKPVVLQGSTPSTSVKSGFS